MEKGFTYIIKSTIFSLHAFFPHVGEHKWTLQEWLDRISFPHKKESTCSNKYIKKCDCENFWNTCMLKISQVQNTAKINHSDFSAFETMYGKGHKSNC